MKLDLKRNAGFMDSILVTGITLAAVYWVCESFMFFFMQPEANFIQHLLGPDRFEIVITSYSIHYTKLYDV